MRTEEVRKSTQSAASARLRTPVCASAHLSSVRARFTVRMPSCARFVTKPGMRVGPGVSGDCLLRNEEVVGSNPITSTTNSGPYTRLRAGTRSLG